MNLKNNIISLVDDRQPIVIHHTNELTLGGTEKLIQLNMPYYITDGTFDHYLAYKSNGDKTREPLFEKIMGKEKMLPYNSEDHFTDIVRKLKPYIVHRYSAGIPEFPFVPKVKEHTKHFVSTSTFGDQDETIGISRVIYISSHIRNLRGKQYEPGHTLCRIPVAKPASNTDLRDDLVIPINAFVFGRIGRDSNNLYNPINVDALKIVQEKHKDVFFVAVAPSEKMIEHIKEIGINNFRIVEKTTDEKILSSFYNTIDVLAHSRMDGECNPLNIREAFSHGKPVISHYGNFFNGHIEAISDCGFIVVAGDVNGYAKHMENFITNKYDYEKLSKNCLKNWRENSTVELSSSDHLKVYLDIRNSEVKHKNDKVSLWPK